VHILAGDIGGTKTLLAIYDTTGGRLSQLRVERFENRNFESFEAVLRAFLRSEDAVERAAFAVAGPVVLGRAKITNLPWVMDSALLARDLAVPTGLLNDFAAVALGLDVLDASELRVLQPGALEPDGPRAVLGAGTGLGEAVIVPGAPIPRILASEGGHADFAPRDEDEIDLFRFVRARHARVSVERIVSGGGLVTIFEWLLETGRIQPNEAIAREMESKDPAQVIGERALAGDPVCREAVRRFLSAYGAEAGNLALKVLPTGGLFVAGGIAGKLLPIVEDGTLLSSFLEKGRMKAVLERIPLAVVTNPQVGLLGAARAGRDQNFAAP
jgi:glucokinase